MAEVPVNDVIAEREWILCSECGGMIYGKRLARHLRVCPECGAHHRMSAHERLIQLLDEDAAGLLESVVLEYDPLDFVDTIPYAKRIMDARVSTGLDEAVIVARGAIQGMPVIVAAMDFQFLGGSLGGAVGELITTAAEIALAGRAPLLLVTASGGARMQEGVLSLMQMAKTAQALAQLDEAGVLTISVVTDPTFGGVAASFATLTDVIIAEPRARMGFAGPRVIEQAIGQTLPPDFQTAEFLLAHGLIDAIRPRAELRGTLARLLSIGGQRAGGFSAVRPAVDDTGVVMRSADQLPEVDAWHAVQTARDVDRPTTREYVSRVFDDFDELHGDRMGEDCAAIVGGMARLDGSGVMVIGHQKGRTAGEDDMTSPGGYRKAGRLMRTAVKLGLPVITFVDTPGPYPGMAAEEQGQAIAIAESIRLMAALPVPVVAMVIGEACGGGALALAVADEVLICANGVYSVISPEACAAMLWDDPDMGAAAVAALRVGAGDLLRLGIVDGVVSEPDGGSQVDHHEAAHRVRTALVAALRRLENTDGITLVANRRARFRSFGVPTVTGSDSRQSDVDRRGQS